MGRLRQLASHPLAPIGASPPVNLRSMKVLGAPPGSFLEACILRACSDNWALANGGKLLQLASHSFSSPKAECWCQALDRFSPRHQSPKGYHLLTRPHSPSRIPPNGFILPPHYKPLHRVPTPSWLDAPICPHRQFLGFRCPTRGMPM